MRKAIIHFTNRPYSKDNDNILQACLGRYGYHYEMVFEGKEYELNRQTYCIETEDSFEVLEIYTTSYFLDRGIR